MNISIKKAVIVNASAFGFLALSSVCAYILRYVIEDAVTALLIGGGILAVSGICALFTGKAELISYPVFLLSSVAMGFLIRSWYIFRGFDNSLPLMLAVSLGATLCLWLFWLLSKIPAVGRHPVLFTVIYVALSIVAYLLVMLNTKTTYVSTLGYYMLVEIAFLVAMYGEWDDLHGLVRALSLSTFSVFGLVALAAVLIGAAVLSGDGDCDADCCECVECCDIGEINTKRKKK